MNQPLISVLLSVYNGEKFVAEAVQSLLNQTYRNFELIIVDDGSSDRTAEILNQFTDNRIKRLSNEKNFGLSQSLNRAGEIAQGKYLARMDADDVSLPDRFAKQVAFLEAHDKVGVLGSAAAQINSQGRVISTLLMPTTHALILWRFFFDLAIVHSTVMMRRDLFRLIGGYDVSFIHVEDNELWSRLLSLTQFANLEDVFVKRRLHNDSISSINSNQQRRLSTMVRKFFFNNTIHCQASYETLRWFVDPFFVLTERQKKELIFIFIRLYRYLTTNFVLDREAEQVVEEDFFRRVSLAFNSDRRAVRKFLFRQLRDILPLTVRHCMKTSKLGYFFAQRI